MGRGDAVASIMEQMRANVVPCVAAFDAALEHLQSMLYHTIERQPPRRQVSQVGFEDLPLWWYLNLDLFSL